MTAVVAAVPLFSEFTPRPPAPSCTADITLNQGRAFYTDKLQAERQDERQFSTPLVERTFYTEKLRSELKDELQFATDRGEVHNCTVHFSHRFTDTGYTLESSWADTDVQFASSRGKFGLQLGLLHEHADASAGRTGTAWRVFARLKPRSIMYGVTDGQRDSHRHRAARVVFQVGSSGSLCGIIPDHRRPKNDENDRRTVVNHKEIHVVTSPVDIDDILTELEHSVDGSLQLSVNVTVRDAGAPLEEDFTPACGCCS